MKKVNKDYLCLAAILGVAGLLRAYHFVKFSPPSISIDDHILSKIIDLVIIGIVFSLTTKIMRSRRAGLFAAALSVGVPIYGWNVSFELYHTLALFLYLLTISIFVSVKDMEDWWFGLFVPVILAFIHIYSLFLIAALLLFALLVKIEKLEFNKKEVSFIWACSVIVTLIFLSFSITPTLFLVIKQYVNIGYYTLSAENFTLAKALAIAGTLPIYLGVLGIYYSIRRRSKPSLVLLSTAGVFLTVMLFNVVPISLGLPYFILSLAVFSGFVYEKFVKTLDISRFKKHKYKVVFLVFVAVLAVEAGHWLLTSPIG